MILRIISSAAALAACLVTASAQTSVTTDPVGFTTSSCAAESDTFVGMPFTRPPTFVGAVQSVSGSTIAVGSSPGWTANQFVYAAGVQPNHYYILIGAGGSANPKQGHTYFISSNDSSTVTISSSLDDLSGITASTQVSIIPYWTPATLFPASDANVSFTPTTSTSAYKTELLVPNYSAPGINVGYSPAYFFSNNVNGTSSNVGWRIVGDNSTDHGDDPLSPDSYFVVRNANGAPALSLTAAGSVLLKKMAVPLITSASQQQDNPASVPRPINVTLNALGLNSSDGSFVAGDQLLVYTNAQSGFNPGPSATYYYNQQAGTSGGWRLLGDDVNDRGSDIIPSSAGLVIRKAATSNGQTAFWTNSFPLIASSAVSRLTHGSAGTFDIPLPLSGASGVECRNGGSYQIVVSFPAAVSFTGSKMTSGAATIASVTGSGSSTLKINLSSVTNGQRLVVTLAGATDGTYANDIAIPMRLIVGNTTGSGSVNGGDVGQTKSQSGQVVSASNFREDVTADGNINGADVGLVKSLSGTGAPGP